MSEIVRVGVIGAGRIAQRHFRAYGENADKAKVVCAADPNLRAARESAEKFGFKDIYEDYREVLRRDDVEAVSICAPTALHPVIAIAAFEAGKHVLCEKPAGLDASLFRKAMEAGRRSGKVFAMGFMERQMSNAKVLRDLIQSGRIGRPIVARTAAFGSTLHRIPSFVDAEVNGGPFIDMFCHNVDTWSCAFEAKVVSVSANGFIMSEQSAARAKLKSPAIDTGEAVLAFDSGDLGALSAAWSLPDLAELNLLKKSLGDSFLGPKGFILGGVRGTLRVVTAQGVEEFPNDGIDAAHRKQVSAFCDAIRKGTPPGAPPEAGLYTLQVSLAVLKSIREKRVVRIEEI